jgi:phospholipase C
MRHRSAGSVRRRAYLPAGLTVATFILFSSLGGATAGVSPTARAPVLAAFDNHISHIVFVMMENHAYDNYFGTYCQVTSKYCRATGNGILPGTCVPEFPNDPALGCIAPFNFTVAQQAPPDLNHDWNSTHDAYNGGAMNGFYLAEGSTPEPFGHYNGTTIPVDWDLAEQYGLADDFFSSAASYSLPNHWFLVSASPPGIIERNFPGAGTVASKHQYLNESNATLTLQDELTNSSVSWRYYDWALPNYTKAINPAPASDAWNLWNPLAARGQSYATSERSHFAPETRFASDASNGTLPSLSWVIPPALYSDHPPYNVTAGQTWLASVVDAVEGSPEWNSTVVFVSWDEYGGFYDHVAPPVLDGVGDGLRVPLLAIGPWVKQGVIDHAQMDFGSILHLMELRFGLGCLGPRDCQATLPMGMFDFNRSARVPILIHGYASASYPMPLQSSGQLPPFNASQAPSIPGSTAVDPRGAVFADGGLG